MDISKLNPWNWFKHEEAVAVESPNNLPAKRHEYATSSPSNDMVQLHREINRLFDEMFRGFPTLANGTLFNRMWNNDFAPLYRASLNVASSEQNYIITLEAPGLDEKDIELELKDKVLFIRGNKQQDKTEKEQSYYRIERHYGSFERVLSLPDDVDTETINADMRNGVLTIQIPRKSIPRKEVKRITINKP